MADFAGPSFSLGFDLDLDFPPNEKRNDGGIDRMPHQEAESSSGCTFLSGEETLGDDPSVMEAPFKRLRKGISHKSFSDPSTPPADLRFPNLDDDIEEFSSPEDCIIRDDIPSRQIHSSCSSSKVPLHSQRFLTTVDSKKSTPSNFKQTKTASIPTSVEASSNKKVFPKITLSPLKKIHLLDSDSEESPKINKVRKFNVETPAFDQFCEEHFQSLMTESQTQSQRTQNQDIEPPCYAYFFHPDTRIQNIVRKRLPNFKPIGSNQEMNSDFLDYMGQFGEKKGPAQNLGANFEMNKKGRTANRSKGKGTRISDKAGTSAAVPKDASKRKVSAVGSCGHWYTGDHGRKVYVTKDGKELTGRIAYRQYKKDSKGGRKKAGKGASGSASKKKPRK